MTSSESPAFADYPAPMLNYEEARQARMEALSNTRHGIGDIPSALARLPADLTPFGSDQIAGSQVLWAQPRAPELFPEAVDLDRLDREGWLALLSWFSLRRSAETGEAGESPRRDANPSAAKPTTASSAWSSTRQLLGDDAAPLHRLDLIAAPGVKQQRL